MILLSRSNAAYNYNLRHNLFLIVCRWWIVSQSPPPLFQVANLVTLQGKDQPFVRNVMTLKSCAPIVGVDVMSFDSEREVLLAWRVNLFDFIYDFLLGSKRRIWLFFKLVLHGLYVQWMSSCWLLLVSVKLTSLFPCSSFSTKPQWNFSAWNQGYRMNSSREKMVNYYTYVYVYIIIYGERERGRERETERGWESSE